MLLAWYAVVRCFKTETTASGMARLAQPDRKAVEVLMLMTLRVTEVKMAFLILHPRIRPWKLNLHEQRFNSRQSRMYERNYLLENSLILRTFLAERAGPSLLHFNAKHS
jgi:hypothetical protein